MARCEHCDAPLSDSDWHPKKDGKKGTDKDSVAQRRPHCVKCGMVRNISSNAAKGTGFYTNVLSEIRERVNVQSKRTGGVVAKFTTSQMRLIVKELEEDEEFEDKYIHDKLAQQERFIEAVRKYRPDLRPEFIREFL